MWEPVENFEILIILAENPLAVFSLVMILCYGFYRLVTWK